MLPISGCLLLCGLLMIAGQAAARTPEELLTDKALPARRELESATDAEPSRPYGWWQTLMVPGAYCWLKDFPPLPNGYGTCKVICPKGYKYNHEFLYRLFPAAGGNFSSPTTVTTSGIYNLRVFNLMQSYSRLSLAGKANFQVIAGVDKAMAHSFTVQKSSGVGAVNMTGEMFYLKSGNKYCYVKGSGLSSYMYCDTSMQANATMFSMPYSSYHGATLTNLGASRACGSMLIPVNNEANSTVNCTTPTSYQGNYITTWTVGLKTPGAPVFKSGVSVVIKAHQELYRHLVSYWAASSSSPFNVVLTPLTDPYKSSDARQWMSLELLRGGAGSTIKSGDTILIKNTALGSYCGISTSMGNALVCDRKTVVASNLAYQFKFTY